MSISGQIEDGVFHCEWCGSENHTFIDPSQGESQEYVEDCQTCCRPHVLQVTHDAAGDSWQITARPE